MANRRNVDEYIESFPADAPVPTKLLEKMIKHRLEEFERDGVLWM